jgi:hypothetical protein
LPPHGRHAFARFQRHGDPPLAPIGGIFRLRMFNNRCPQAFGCISDLGKYINDPGYDGIVNIRRYGEICAIVMIINDRLPTLCDKLRVWRLISASEASSKEHRAQAGIGAKEYFGGSLREQAIIYLPNINMG